MRSHRAKSPSHIVRLPRFVCECGVQNTRLAEEVHFRSSDTLKQYRATHKHKGSCKLPSERLWHFQSVLCLAIVRNLPEVLLNIICLMTCVGCKRPHPLPLQAQSSQNGRHRVCGFHRIRICCKTKLLPCYLRDQHRVMQRQICLTEATQATPLRPVQSSILSVISQWHSLGAGLCNRRTYA